MTAGPPLCGWRQRTAVIRLPMGLTAFRFEPIAVNANAPRGACILRSFDDITAFILTNVEHRRGLSPHWIAVRRDLLQARYGARRAEVHQAMRDALKQEGWMD